MNKKTTYLIIAVIVVLAVIFVLVSCTRTEKKEVGPEQVGPEQGTGEGIVPEQSLTRQEVPEDVMIPELNQEVKDEEIAVPLTVSPASPQGEAMFRRFEISAENDKYSPSEVLVKQGDTVHIDFTAVDKEYDITFPDYGMKQTAQKGEKKILEFQALNPGKFLYYCELCGGIDGNTKGYITVVPKE